MEKIVLEKEVLAPERHRFENMDQHWTAFQNCMQTFAGNLDSENEEGSGILEDSLHKQDDDAKPKHSKLNALPKTVRINFDSSKFKLEGEEQTSVRTIFQNQWDVAGADGTPPVMLEDNTTGAMAIVEMDAASVEEEEAAAAEVEVSAEVENQNQQEAEEMADQDVAEDENLDEDENQNELFGGDNGPVDDKIFFRDRLCNWSNYNEDDSATFIPPDAVGNWKRRVNELRDQVVKPLVALEQEAEQEQGVQRSPQEVWKQFRAMTAALENHLNHEFGYFYKTWHFCIP